MLFDLLFGSSRRPRRRPGQARQRGFRPALESLDQRWLPSAGPILPAAAPAAALAAPADPGQAQPFHLSGTGLFTPLSQTDYHFEASGTAAGLGRWTNEGDLHFDGPHGTGVAVFTAANGDKLVALIDGTILDPQTGESVATFTFVASATRADGTVATSTGRYANVSGTASMQATGLPNFTFTLSGEVSYSASDRSAGGHTASADGGIEAASKGGLWYGDHPGRGRGWWLGLW